MTKQKQINNKKEQKNNNEYIKQAQLGSRNKAKDSYYFLKHWIQTRNLRCKFSRLEIKIASNKANLFEDNIKK